MPNEQIHPDQSVEQFQDWYYKFIAKYQSGTPQVKVPAKRFYEEVTESHKAIRERIGGIRRIEEIQLEDVQMAVPLHIVTDLMRPVKSYLPEYYKKHNIQDQFLRYPIVPPDINQTTQGHAIQNPDGTVTILPKTKQRRGQSWANHLASYIRKNKSKLSPQQLAEISKNICLLGQQWALAKTKKQSLWVNMTTSPMAFCNLGHYGPDSTYAGVTGSCFRQGGQRNRDKYVLGIYPGTFVMLVSTSNELEVSEHNDNPNIICRAFGVSSPDVKVFNLCNHYPRKGDKILSEANILKGMEEFFHKLIGDSYKIDRNLLKLNNNNNDPDGIWLNARDSDRNGRLVGVQWTIFDKNLGGLTNDKYSFDIKVKGCLLDNCTCPTCRHAFVLKDMQIVEGSYICKECVAKMNKCEHSGEYYSGMGIEAYSREGKKIKISPRIAAKEFKKCSVSGIYSHNSDVVTMSNGYYASKFCLTEYGIIKCKSCNTYAKGKKEICSNCKLKAVDYHTTIHKTKRKIVI